MGKPDKDGRYAMHDTYNFDDGKPRTRVRSAIQNDGNQRVSIASSEKLLRSVSQSQTRDARGTRVRAFQTQPPSASRVNGGEKRAAPTRRDCSLEQTRAAVARVPQ